MYEHSTAYAHFTANLPVSPQATNDFARHGLYRQTQHEALTARYIQPDRVYQTAWLKLDLDNAESGAHWIDQGLPRPHFIMVNPRNGHAHYLLGLTAPVITSMAGHLAPLRFFAGVEAGYTRLLSADPAYTGHTVKTPGHPDWITHVHDGPLYSLSDLRHALPASITTRPVPRAEYVGNSRNLSLFDNLRYWAYGEAKAAKQAGNFERWQQAVHAHAHTLNAFTSPLGQAEVRHTANSVARWTWRHAEQLSVSAIGGVKRSKVKSWQRPEMSESEARERMSEGGQHGIAMTNAMRRNRTFDLIVNAIAELAGRGNQCPTNRQVAEVAGLHLNTVQRFRTAEGLPTPNQN